MRQNQAASRSDGAHETFALPSAEPAISALTIADEVASIAPGRTWQSLSRWPPDVFAATSTILADSGVYRSVICPPERAAWPPTDGLTHDSSWEASVSRWGAEWMTWATSASSSLDGSGPPPPEPVSRFSGVLDAAAETPLSDLDDAECWQTVTAILSLHAMADEACVGAGLDLATEFQRIAAGMLVKTSSLSSLPVDRVRVLPKLRPPESGITLRSISHNLAFDRSEVRASWLRAPERRISGDRPSRSRLTLLLVPFPTSIHANDFVPIPGPLLNMDEARYGFFEYVPTEPLDLAGVVELVDTARRRVGAIDAVVLPEAAVDESSVPTLRRSLTEAGVPYVITGARRPRGVDAPFGANYVAIGGVDWQTEQYKHHRWCLDPEQVHQYHLGAALDPGHRWWEAIHVGKRNLKFVTIPHHADLTICSLICEDLARPDPVTDVIRAVAPTLVVALLLDGPQLAARWPARYASVFADDPGCSVLTLTALGMVWRSQPPGFEPSRVVALWKDPHRGLQEIKLAEDARAVALTAHHRQVQVTSADGRRNARPISELVLSGLEQID